uniref:DH domain-containing protein n=1 Tax=Trichobilharzia regenti TaxID=157069 RepID=A0AA85JRY4_TRIRE|nr:unnamed protein product [Trichobilharzia regenti]
MAWEELLSTEEVYIEILQNVYNMINISKDTDYNRTVSVTQLSYTMLNEKLLGNWFELLSFHKKRLLPSLAMCNGNAKMIKYWASVVAPYLIDLYTTYCSLYAKASQLCAYLDRISCKQISLLHGDKETHEMPKGYQNSTRLFKCHLSTPVRRIQCYHLLFERLKTEAHISDIKYLDDVRKIFNKICATLDITMNLRSLNVRPSKLGYFLLEGDFAITQSVESIKSKKRSHVILFSKMLLITKPYSSSSSSSSTPSLKTYLSERKSCQKYFPSLEDYIAFFEFSHNTSLNSSKIVYEVEDELCIS